MFRTTLQANVLCCGQSLGSKKVLEAVKERPQIMKRERWVKTTSEVPEHWRAEEILRGGADCLFNPALASDPPGISHLICLYLIRALIRRLL